MGTALQFGNRINIWAWLSNLATNDVGILSNAGAPTNGTSGTGAAKAGKGCLLVDTTNGIVYINTNTKASPTWSPTIFGEPGTNSILFDEFAQDGIVASATQTQAAATALVAQTSRVITVATVGDGVRLPVSRAGLEVLVINHGANAMRVYGAGTDKIDDVATATGVLQMAMSLVIYTCTTAGDWYSEGLATGFGGPGLATVAFTDNIAANATQTQAAATALVSQYNRIITVTTAGDGVRLPASAPGLAVTIDNQGANPCKVYGASTDTINGIATATGVFQSVKSIVTYFCTVSGNWELSLAGNSTDSFSALSVNGAIPVASHFYVITKAGVLADTLAAPAASPGGDGIDITITSDTANAHTVTFTGNTLDSGSASVLTATFAANKGAGLRVVSYNARWKVISSVGITFS